jgi:hypothetical protein
MRISVDARERDFEPALNWIGSLVGAALDKRVAGFEAQERKNPLLATHFRETFALEFTLTKARKYRQNTGRLPKGDEHDLLYGFLIPAQRIHGALPANVRTPFEGRLRDAVNGAYGARPFAYEISIATHLMQKGWDVEFADYAGTTRFDFLARQGAVEIEIKCKSTSGDTGRKIHRQEVNRLADMLLPTTERLAGMAGCHSLLVTMPDRLGKSNEALSGIASIVASSIAGRVAKRCSMYRNSRRTEPSTRATIEYKLIQFRCASDGIQPGSRICSTADGMAAPPVGAPADHRKRRGSGAGKTRLSAGRPIRVTGSLSGCNGAKSDKGRFALLYERKNVLGPQR